MDYRPYLPHYEEPLNEYFDRIWLSDLWDKMSLASYDVPNEQIRNIQCCKYHVWTASREQLAVMADNLERKMMDRSISARSYRWLQTYCRRIYKRKNMLCAEMKYPEPKRPVSPGFVPTKLNTAHKE